MYRIVRASIQYYDDFMKGSGARHALIAPYVLWIHVDRFLEEKERGTDAYTNLSDIVDRMKTLFRTGDPRYHHFEMLLGELQVLGFDMNGMVPARTTDPEMLREQIDLLLQFLASRYPFDPYDSRIGVHDPATGSFYFHQP